MIFAEIFCDLNIVCRLLIEILLVENNFFEKQILLNRNVSVEHVWQKMFNICTLLGADFGQHFLPGMQMSDIFCELGF